MPPKRHRENNNKDGSEDDVMPAPTNHSVAKTLAMPSLPSVWDTVCSVCLSSGASLNTSDSSDCSLSEGSPTHAVRGLATPSIG